MGEAQVAGRRRGHCLRATLELADMQARDHENAGIDGIHIKLRQLAE
jgi:hypothetical protein